MRSFMADRGGMTNSFITQRLQHVGWDHSRLTSLFASASFLLMRHVKWSINLYVKIRKDAPQRIRSSKLLKRHTPRHTELSRLAVSILAPNISIKFNFKIHSLVCAALKRILERQWCTLMPREQVVDQRTVGRTAEARLPSGASHCWGKLAGSRLGPHTLWAVMWKWKCFLCCWFFWNHMNSLIASAKNLKITYISLFHIFSFFLRLHLKAEANFT